MPLVNSLVNGQPQSLVNIEDRALHYADGLFETMLFQNGEIALWPQHFERLTLGCERLKLKPPNKENLTHDIKSLTKLFTGSKLIIKLIMSRGAAGRGLKVDVSTAVSCFLLAYDFNQNSLINPPKTHLKICSTKLIINDLLGGVKHLNRLIYVLAANELSAEHAEGVMLNDKHEIIECIQHNIFFVRDHVLITAPITNCGVAGIKRQQIINLALNLKLTVQTKAIKLADLKDMDECFITNAVVGIQSVQSIDDIIFNNNNLTIKLQNNLKTL